MINWNEIYTKYLQGAKPAELAEEYGIESKKISAKIKSEKWAQARNKLKEKIAGNFEKKLENLAQKAFLQLENILNDEMASPASKIQAAKAIIDFSGFKKDKKENNQEISYEVYINRESVKCR